MKDEFEELPTNMIAENLIRLRKLNNLTQKELSVATGINKSNISKYERGELFPTKNISIKLAIFFDIGSTYFYDDYLESIADFKLYLLNLINKNAFISKNELCKLLRISKRTLHRYYYGNDIPSRNVFLKFEKYMNRD